MTEKEMKLAELEAALQSSRADCERISEEMQESRKNTRKDALNNLRTARSEYNAANLEHEKADDARDACRAALCSCVIGQRDPVEVGGEVRADVAASLKFKKCAERKNRLWPAIAVWLVAIVFATVGIVFDKSTWWQTAVAVLLGVLLLVIRGKRVRESRSAYERRKAILAKYKADDEEMIKMSEKEFLRLHGAFTEAEELEHSTAAYLEQCRIKLEELENRTLEELDFNGGSGEAAELTRLFNERSQMCQDLAMEIERLKSE